jgi:hypothetical protein
MLLAVCTSSDHPEIVAAINEPSRLDSVVRFLVNVLRDGDACMKSRAQQAAAGALLNLAKRHGVDVLMRVIRSFGPDVYYDSGAVVDILLIFLKYFGHEHAAVREALKIMRDQAPMAVRAVRLGDTQQTLSTVLVKAGAIPLLVRLLKHADTDTKRDAAATLEVFRVHADEVVYSRTVGLAAAAAELVEIVRTADLDGKGFAAVCLGLLSGDADAAEIAIRAGAVEVLAELGRLGDAAGKRFASVALRSLAVHVVAAGEGARLLQLVRLIDTTGDAFGQAFLQQLEAYHPEEAILAAHERQPGNFPPRRVRRADGGREAFAAVKGHVADFANEGYESEEPHAEVEATREPTGDTAPLLPDSSPSSLLRT